MTRPTNNAVDPFADRRRATSRRRGASIFTGSSPGAQPMIRSGRPGPPGPAGQNTKDQNTKVASGIGSSPAFFGSSVDRDAGVRARSTIWMIGSDRRVATATVFFVRLPLPFRAAGREVITLDRIQSPGDSVRLRLYGSGESTVNVGNLIPLHRTGSAV